MNIPHFSTAPPLVVSSSLMYHGVDEAVLWIELPPSRFLRALRGGRHCAQVLDAGGATGSSAP